MFISNMPLPQDLRTCLPPCSFSRCQYGTLVYMKSLLKCHVIMSIPWTVNSSSLPLGATFPIPFSLSLFFSVAPTTIWFAGYLFNVFLLQLECELHKSTGVSSVPRRVLGTLWALIGHLWSEKREKRNFGKKWRGQSHWKRQEWKQCLMGKPEDDEC